jgi:preprotein translocase SecE subunit
VLLYGQLAQAKWFGVQESVYIQGAGAALVFLIAGGFVYYFVGINKHTAEFLIATEGEMRKVHWSTKREIYGSTVVVILVSLVIALLLFVGDYAFAALFRAIGVLQG